MKEKDLVKMGMQRRDVSEEESGDAPYHYYSWEPYEGSAFGLISSASDDKPVKKKDDWKVYLFDDPRVEFKKADDVELFMEVVKRNTKKK